MSSSQSEKRTMLYMYTVCFWSRSCTNARTLMPHVGQGDFLIMNMYTILFDTYC